jgi:hypothetical protein
MEGLFSVEKQLSGLTVVIGIVGRIYNRFPVYE